MKIKNPIESDISLRAQFYLELIKHVIKTNILYPKTKFGDGDGLIVFLSTNICFDSAVFIYECIQYFEEHNKELYTEIFEHLTVESYERIKDVRNNMHLYNKKGSYQKKLTKLLVIESMNLKLGPMKIMILPMMISAVCITMTEINLFF